LVFLFKFVAPLCFSYLALGAPVILPFFIKISYNSGNYPMCYAVGGEEGILNFIQSLEKSTPLFKNLSMNGKKNNISYSIDQ
jgi:hypothetical protein